MFWNIQAQTSCDLWCQNRKIQLLKSLSCCIASSFKDGKPQYNREVRLAVIFVVTFRVFGGMVHHSSAKGGLRRGGFSKGACAWEGGGGVKGGLRRGGFSMGASGASRGL